MARGFDSLTSGTSLSGDAGRFETVTWTDEGHLISQANRGTGLNLWELDPTEERPRQLTEGEYSDRGATWVPGQKAIVFISNRSGGWNVWRLNTDTNEYAQLTQGSDYLESPTCSPDGQWVLYTDWNSNRPTVMRISSKGGTPKAAIQADARHASSSPDGTLIVAEVFRESPAQKVRGSRRSSPRQQASKSRSCRRFHQVRRCGGRLTGRALTTSSRTQTGCRISGPIAQWRKPRQIDGLREEQIFDYAWSADGRRLACPARPNME